MALIRYVFNVETIKYGKDCMTFVSFARLYRWIAKICIVFAIFLVYNNSWVLDMKYLK